MGGEINDNDISTKELRRGQYNTNIHLHVRAYRGGVPDAINLDDILS